MARRKGKRKTAVVQLDTPEKKPKKELLDAEDVICLNTPPHRTPLDNWCIEKQIPLDYEQKLLGVEFCNDFRHLQFASLARQRCPEACKTFDQTIWSHYQYNGQNYKVFSWKMEVRDKLFNEFKKLFNDYYNMSLWAVGSTVNGCGSFNSDMDLCLCLPERTTTGTVYFTERTRCLKTLRKIQNVLRRPPLRGFVRNTEVIMAKVPIIKVDLHPPYEELDLDININNIAGVYNSHLIHYYSRVDSRFPAICLLIKHWAIRKDISDAMHGTFNSYSLILLVLHYLQCGVKPAVLPNLQYLMPNLFTSQMPLEVLELYKDLQGLPARPVNDMEIGDLLLGFFSYYNSFDFEKYFISVRAGKRCPRTLLEPEDAKFYIFIEEPFDLINTARCVTKEVCYQNIKRAFKEAVEALSRKSPMVQNIGIQI